MSKVEPMDKMEEAEAQNFERSTTKQVVLGLLTNFTNIAPSMSLGFSAVALPTLTDPINPLLNSEQASWFASIASLATPFGCLLSGPIADRYGRKPAMYTTNLACLLGWLLLYTAHLLPHHAYLYPLLLLARLLTGLSTGLASVPATIYMAEIATANLRSIFCTWATLFFAIGVLIIYIFGWIFTTQWHLMALIAAIFPLLASALLWLFVPESPAWLVRKNRTEEARHALATIFGAKVPKSRIDAEIHLLLQTKIAKQTKTKSILEQFARKLKQLTKRNCLKPLSLILTYFFFQQFAGTFVIVFYAIDIVKNAGIQFDEYLAIVLIGVVRLLAAILLSYVSKKYGRRPLSLVSGAGMTLTMLALGAYLAANVEKMAAVPVTLLLLYFLTSTLGFLPMPFAMAAEVFPAKIRGTATGLASGIGYFFNFLTVKTYPAMVDVMGKGGVFFFYGSVALVGTVFVWAALPETRGKSLAEIEAFFGRKKVRRSGSLLKEAPKIAV